MSTMKSLSMPTLAGTEKLFRRGIAIRAERMAVSLSFLNRLPMFLMASMLVVSAPARLIAQQVEYYHLDALGSVRAVTDENGAVITRHDYLPYGGEWNAPPSSDTRRFTGKQRDAETGLYYFGARYLATGLGRFHSPDPIGVMGQQMVDPQQWNKYSYVRGNPIRLVDPTGMYICSGSGSQCGSFEKGRKDALNSANAEVVSGAAAYGGANVDNGVTVSFGNPGKGKAGSAEASLVRDPNDSSKWRANVAIVMRSGQSALELRAAIAHEGIHARDAQRFVATISSDGRQYDLSKNLTSWETEMNAYRGSAAVMAEANRTANFGTCGGGSCSLGAGMTASGIDATIRSLLSHPANGYNYMIQDRSGNWIPSLGMRQFSAITNPP